jgi:hypothetical protein
MPFGLPDAAVVSQMAKKDNVPPDMLMHWGAQKGIPPALITLMLKYDALKSATQSQPPGGAQPPQTTVAQDVDTGLAALRQQRMPTQAPTQMPPQMPQQDQGIAAAQSQQGYARGGVIAFANRGAVDTSNSARTSSSSKESTSYGIPEYLQAVKTQQQHQQEALDEQKAIPEFKPSMDPSYEEDRQRILMERTAAEHDVPIDRWQALVAAGIAMAKSASTPRRPGESNMLTDLTAGTEAGINKLNAINDAYKAKKTQLDKDLVEANRLKFTAEETNRKDLYNAHTAKLKDVAKQQDELDGLWTEGMKEAVGLGISQTNASANATNARVNARTPVQMQEIELYYQQLKAEDDARVKRGQQSAPTPTAILKGKAALMQQTAAVNVTAGVTGEKTAVQARKDAEAAAQKHFGFGQPGEKELRAAKDEATKKQIIDQYIIDYMRDAAGGDQGGAGDTGGVVDFNSLK